MDFALPPHLEVVHQPVRLRIMTLLHRQRDLGFSSARLALDLTAGNLASHLSRLTEAGFVEQRKVFSRDGVEARIRLTMMGATAYREYLSVLRAYLDGLSEA